MITSNWFERVSGHFDLIVCNPPYIPENDLPGLAPDVVNWEPHAALSPGAEGLESYRLILADIGRFMAPGGLALLEFGVGQGPQISDIARANDLTVKNMIRDLSGKERAIALTSS